MYNWWSCRLSRARGDEKRDPGSRKADVSDRPQRAHRGRHLARRAATLFAALAVGAGVAFAIWPANGDVGAAPAPEAAAVASSSAAPPATARSQPAAETPASR